ncbi:unnamed protein product, partial [Symbiodinium pilosum]
EATKTEKTERTKTEKKRKRRDEGEAPAEPPSSRNHAPDQQEEDRRATPRKR